MEIHRYVVVDRNDDELSDEIGDLDTAIDLARENDAAVIARIYEYTDTAVEWTPDGSDRWPPDAVLCLNCGRNIRLEDSPDHDDFWVHDHHGAVECDLTDPFGYEAIPEETE